MGETAWGAMLRTAVSMGVAPSGFWRLSLKEWRMLTAMPTGVATMGRAEMDALIEAWPDEGKR